MRKILTATILTLSLNANFILGAYLYRTVEDARQSQAQESLQKIQQEPEHTDWDAFIEALAWVESRWVDTAVSPKQAVGYLQVTPILVEDANRIEGYEMFTLEGRTDREESIRLFNVIMDNYNPQHDMHLALKIWNPYSKVSYHRAVMSKYEALRKTT